MVLTGLSHHMIDAVHFCFRWNSESRMAQERAVTNVRVKVLLGVRSRKPDYASGLERSIALLRQLLCGMLRHVFDNMFAENCRATVVRKWQAVAQVPDNIDPWSTG
jgi:hypothetical protein